MEATGDTEWNLQVSKGDLAIIAGLVSIWSLYPECNWRAEMVHTSPTTAAPEKREGRHCLLMELSCGT